jgi:hypothetical protein
MHILQSPCGKKISGRYLDTKSHKKALKNFYPGESAGSSAAPLRGRDEFRERSYTTPNEEAL